MQDSEERTTIHEELTKFRPITAYGWVATLGLAYMFFCFFLSYTGYPVFATLETLFGVYGIWYLVTQLRRYEALLDEETE